MFYLVLTVVVMIAIALAILIFERPRARRIQRDLADEATRQRRHDSGGRGADAG